MLSQSYDQTTPQQHGGLAASAWGRVRRRIVIAQVLGVSGFIGLLVAARYLPRDGDLCRAAALIWFFVVGFWSWRLEMRARWATGRSRLEDDAEPR